MRKHPVKFTHTDAKTGESHEVRAFVTELTEPDMPDLEGQVSDEARRSGNYRPHIARYLALVKCVEKERIKVDNKTYSVRAGSKAPPVVRNEKGHTTLDHLLGYVIKHNPDLVELDDLREAFEEYALDDEVPEEDPFGSPEEET